jgi:hypothetical protein
MPVNQGIRRSQGIDELSRDVIALSRADIALSKAEASLGAFEAAWIKGAKITIVLLLASMVYGLSLVILALREEYVYKKSVNKSFNALQLPLYCLLLARFDGNESAKHSEASASNSGSG